MAILCSIVEPVDVTDGILNGTETVIDDLVATVRDVIVFALLEDVVLEVVLNLSYAELKDVGD